MSDKDGYSEMQSFETSVSAAQLSESEVVVLSHAVASGRLISEDRRSPRSECLGFDTRWFLNIGCVKDRRGKGAELMSTDLTAQ